MKITPKRRVDAVRIADAFGRISSDIARDYMLGFSRRREIEQRAAGIPPKLNEKDSEGLREKRKTPHPTMRNFFYDARTTVEIAMSRNMENRRSSRAVPVKKSDLKEAA